MKIFAKNFKIYNLLAVIFFYMLNITLKSLQTYIVRIRKLGYASYT